MASISLTGKVVGKAGEPAVTIKEISGKEGSSMTIASFSMLDKANPYFKNKDDNPGQFYRVEVLGKPAEFAAERLSLGSWVSVTGQPVWRQWNGQKYLDVKNSQIIFCEDRKTATESDPF